MFETAAQVLQWKLLWGSCVGLVLGVALVGLGRRAPAVARELVLACAGLGAASVVWLMAFMLGVTPASQAEHGVVSHVRQAFGDRPAVRAALRVVDDSLYLSKNDVQRIADAALRN